MATVGVLGTGIMGAPIARRLAEAGHDVRAWNRTLDKVGPILGSGVAESWQPGEAVAQADAVVTMLADAAAVDEVVDGRAVLQALAAGSLWIQMGTIGAAATDRLAAYAQELGIVFVDAPVLGSRAQAEEGALWVLASGPEEARPLAETLFEPLARRVDWLGAAGAGSRLKLAVNSWLLCTLENLAETFALLDGLGLDPARFLELLEGEPFDMPYARVKGPLMLAREFPTSFPLRLARKDLALAVEEAGVELPLVRAALGQFERAVELGHGDADSSAVSLVSRPGP